ncbi:MAG TPA: hypothetical protein VLZ72_01190, partial [Flavobacterium sp.]|nr:hypothetical protein [Flavobacterium sp.]
MKKLFFLMIVLVSVVISSCNQAGTEQNATKDEAVIDKPQLTLTSNRMTPEVLWSFGRLSDPQVSPDGKTILYGVSYYSIEQNKGN